MVVSFINFPLPPFLSILTIIFNVNNIYSGWCKKLAPEYEKAAVILAAQNPPVILGHMNAENAGCTQTPKSFGITSFPHL